MATTLTSNTFETTYKDDFVDSDNYHRILFNSGKALQARELTQSQTIINKEIERFGRNIFKEGALVRPGGVSLETKREFIKLVNGDTDFATVQVGMEFEVSSPNGMKFKVLEKVPASATDPTNEPDTLYVQYTDMGGQAGGTTPVRADNGATLTGPGVISLTAAASNATGVGSKVSVNSGDYFVQGHFVFANQQSLILSKYTSTPSAEVGFKIEEKVINVDDDTALYDNQGASPNLAAPGADRYQIKLTLTTRDAIVSGDNFVYLAKIQDGRIVDQISKEDIYATIGDFIALRTKEESGDYVVSPFRASFNNLSDTQLSLDVSEGIAYVDGYRIEVDAQTLTVNKARDTLELKDQKVPVGYGNYVLVSKQNGEQKGLPNIKTMERQLLKSAIGLSGSTIGTARVRNVENDQSGALRFYLFDIRMDTGQSFGSVKSIGVDVPAGVDRFADVITENGLAVLKETNNNSLIFPLPHKSPNFQDGITDGSMDYNFRTFVTATSDGSGNLSFSAPPDCKFGGSTVDYVITELDDDVATSAPTIGLGVGTTSLAASGAANNKEYQLIATFDLDATSTNSIRTKTLTESTLTISTYDTSTGTGEATPGGQNFIDLGFADCFKLIRLRTTDSNGTDLSDFFTFDNGQRDNFYARGRLLQKPGTTVPTGPVFVRFQHFTHSANTNEPGYFAVESYKDAFNNNAGNLTGGAITGNDAYAAVPSFQRSDGTVVNLRDVLDFRPVQGKKAGANATLYFGSNYDSSDGIVNYLPRPSSAITADITHFQRRKDKLVAVVTNKKDDRVGSGRVVIQEGVSSIDNAKEPNITSGALTLYNFDLNPFTFNESDLSSEFIPNKRFTMRDIGRLEERINKIEETTTLSLLEVDATAITVVDSDGNPRTKAGFLADNFKDETFSDVTNPDYKAAIDFDRLNLRPLVWPKSVRLSYDSSTNTQITRGGDNLTLQIEAHNTLISQDLATQTVNVNPFAVITNHGHIDMSPASDNWVEIEHIADNIVNQPDNIGRRRTRNTFANLSNWRNSWFGQPTAGNAAGSRVDVIVSSDVIRETIADRLLEVTIIPFMRSREIAFRAQGLQPNTQHFAFFGGVDVADWVDSANQAAFNRFITTTDDDANIYNNATEHPNGKSTLTTDAGGNIYGTFVIPSTPTLKFRTGSQEFKLINISVNNDADATSIARTEFFSQGVIETRQRTVRVTRNIVLDTLVRQIPQDPVAQSFRIDHVQNPNGVFVTQVQAFFASKDTIVPVQVQLRRMENGVPVAEPIPGAVKFLPPSSVNATAFSSTTTMANVQAAPTTFEFEEPVFLSPGVDYAVVILAESTNYNVYVAETYQFIVGSTEARITKQPTLGSLFLSQNARTWTPDQNKDLMFKLNIAQFKTSGNTTISNNRMPRYALIGSLPFESVNATKTVRVFHEGHGFETGDKVHIAGLAAGTYQSVAQADIIGSRTITKVDWTGYQFECGGSTNFSSTSRFGNSGILVTQQIHMDTFFPSVQTMLPEDTSLASSVKLTTAASYGDPETSGRDDVTNNYNKPSGFTNITLNEFNTLSAPRAVLSDSNEAALLGGAKSFDLKLALTTTDNKVSPVIDMQRASLIGFENLIDKQVSAGTGGNVPISFVDETNSTGGTHAAKHITNPIELANAAVGLKVILAANRPAEADFKVYHRTGTSDEVLSDKSFVEATKEVDLQPDEDGVTFRDYEYLIGGQGGNLTPFTQFQIKIVMNSTNSSKVPVFRDLRTIALVT